MTDLTIKKEKKDADDCEDLDDCIPELTELLEQVKEENNVSADEGETPDADGKTVSEKCMEDLLREVSGQNSSNSADDDDIQDLQELLLQRKLELIETEEDPGNQDQRRSPSSNRKRKKPEENESTDILEDSKAKRKRKSIDGIRYSKSRSRSRSKSRSKSPANQSRSPTQQTTVDTSTIGPSNNQTQSEEMPTQIESANTSVLDIERLLKADDSDEELPPSSQLPTFMFPPAMGMPMFNPGNQMMGNLPVGGYPLMYNMGLQPTFYAGNMGQMPMMGYGFPQMNIPTQQNEVECLPVVNSAGFSGMPTFKRIKLEKSRKVSNEEVDKAEESAEHKRRKIFETCNALLIQLEFSEPIGKFTYTPTVTKLNPDLNSNSIVQKISNVSYDFHSIGPKLNLTDWGLREIGNNNVDIAKKIAISADRYFAKIAEKANTVARKFIKVEGAKADANTGEIEMEEEETTLSSFLKNSMTQTDPVTCRECVIRKRIVGHNIAVQATVYTGSIGSQTSPMVNDNDRLTMGLNASQLKALNAFSSLIREPPKSTSVEMFRLRESLLNIYNISQRPMQNMTFHEPASPILPITTHVPFRDPRIDNVPNVDQRRFAGHGTMVNRQLTPVMQAPMHLRPPVNMNNYQQHAQQHGQQHAMHMQPVFPGYPPAELRDVRKGYGRGAPRP